MLPQPLLRASTHLEGDRIVPHYLTARDEPWLGALLEEYRRFVGRKRTELHERLREPLAIRAPKAKLRVAITVLDALCTDRPTAAVPPKEARAALFRAAADGRASRASVVSAVATSFAVTAAELDGALFADLQSEALVAELPDSITVSRLLCDANLALASSLVRRAAHVRIVVWGSARSLVQSARYAGLICSLSRVEPSVPVAEPTSGAAEAAAEALTLELFGPLALFQHTAVYGRALASLVPRLASCQAFELTAACALASGARPSSSFVLRSGDPIGKGREIALRERRVEARFRRDFAGTTCNWQLLTEPRPLLSGTALILPDFELIHRHDVKRRWWLEIVGFWTHGSLCEKLGRLRAAGIERLVLCIDQTRACAEGELPADARVIHYKARIDPRAVLAIIEGHAAG